MHATLCQLCRGKLIGCVSPNLSNEPRCLGNVCGCRLGPNILQIIISLILSVMTSLLCVNVDGYGVESCCGWGCYVPRIARHLQPWYNDVAVRSMNFHALLQGLYPAAHILNVVLLSCKLMMIIFRRTRIFMITIIFISIVLCPKYCIVLGCVAVAKTVCGHQPTS